MKTAMTKNQYVQGALMYLNIYTFVDPRFKLNCHHSSLMVKSSHFLNLLKKKLLITVKKETEEQLKQLLHLIGNICSKSPTTDTTQRAQMEIR